LASVSEPHAHGTPGGMRDGPTPWPPLPYSRFLREQGVLSPGAGQGQYARRHRRSPSPRVAGTRLRPWPREAGTRSVSMDPPQRLLHAVLLAFLCCCCLPSGSAIDNKCGACVAIQVGAEWRDAPRGVSPQVHCSAGVLLLRDVALHHKAGGKHEALWPVQPPVRPTQLSRQCSPVASRPRVSQGCFVAVCCGVL